MASLITEAESNFVLKMENNWHLKSFRTEWEKIPNENTMKSFKNLPILVFKDRLMRWWWMISVIRMIQFNSSFIRPLLQISKKHDFLIRERKIYDIIFTLNINENRGYAYEFWWVNFVGVYRSLKFLKDTYIRLSVIETTMVDFFSIDFCNYF